MPISASFATQLYANLDEIVQAFGTPFHIYDEAGLVQDGRRFTDTFSKLPGFREYFAVKALPNLRILALLREELGFGFDCSSIAELEMVRQLGAAGEDIVFSSNNTSRAEFAKALDEGGAILNLDDLTLIDHLPAMPELISFRFNPGTLAFSGPVMGEPQEAKFGLRSDQIEAAYAKARDLGATRFGMHTMLTTNELDWRNYATIIDLLLVQAARLHASMGIALEFISPGGGIGIPYRPEEADFDLSELAQDVEAKLAGFRDSRGFAPRIYLECGRRITGPHGVMVGKVINVMSKYRDFVGIDASMSALMRPGMYAHTYNHITALTADGQEKRGPSTLVDVVGALCENNDKFAKQIALPLVDLGDLLVIHDTGAHGHAMGFQYNGRLRPQELLLSRSGEVSLIRRAETTQDYLITQTDLQRKSLRPKSSQGRRAPD